MRFRTALFLTTLFMLCFTVAAWSSPEPDRVIPGVPQPDSEKQSLSGKIASIDDAAFSLEVAKGKETSTVQFLVDEQTKVDGKLSIGALATVEYRSNGGKNIAIHVVLTPSSGVTLY